MWVTFDITNTERTNMWQKNLYVQIPCGHWGGLSEVFIWSLILLIRDSFVLHSLSFFKMIWSEFGMSSQAQSKSSTEEALSSPAKPKINCLVINCQYESQITKNMSISVTNDRKYVLWSFGDMPGIFPVCLGTLLTIGWWGGSFAASFLSSCVEVVLLVSKVALESSEVLGVSSWTPAISSIFCSKKSQCE